MKRLLGVILALGAVAQTSDKLPVVLRTLTAESTREIEAPGFSIWGEPLCDESGNLFYHLRSGSFDSSELVEISREGRSGAAFRLSPDYSSSTYFNAFFVSPGGDVSIAVQDAGAKPLIFSFDSNGKAGDPTKLDVPAHLDTQDLLVFDDGSILLSGFFNGHAEPDLAGKKYAAVFAPSGAVRKVLDQKALGTVELKPIRGYIADGASALGSDGNAYLAGEGEILVLSSSGEVVKRLKFEKPETGASVTRMNVSKGLIALVFTKVGKGNHLDRQYLVISATSGDVVGWYVPSSETGNIDECFTASEGFTFKNTNAAGKLVFITAPVR